VLGFGTICTLLLIIPIAKKNYLNARLIKVCNPILKKRLRMLFVPIMFTGLLVALVLASLYIIFVMIYNASFNS